MDSFTILSVATFLIATISFLVGAIWALPDAIQDRREIDKDQGGTAIFANYLLLVSILATFSELCFLVMASLVLTLDLESLFKIGGTRTLIFLVVCAVATLIIAGPIARRRAAKKDSSRIRSKGKAQQELSKISTGQQAIIDALTQNRETLEEVKRHQAEERLNLGLEQKKD